MSWLTLAKHLLAVLPFACELDFQMSISSQMCKKIMITIAWIGHPHQVSKVHFGPEKGKMRSSRIQSTLVQTCTHFHQDRSWLLSLWGGCAGEQLKTEDRAPSSHAPYSNASKPSAQPNPGAAADPTPAGAWLIPLAGLNFFPGYLCFT